MPQPMSKQSEERLIDAVTQLAADVDDGHSVTSAAIKSARDHSLNRNFVARMAHAYNTGKQNEQRESSHTALDKFANYEVCDPERVCAGLFSGEEEKQAAEVVASPFWTSTTSLDSLTNSIRVSSYDISATLAGYSTKQAEADHAEPHVSLLKLNVRREYDKQAQAESQRQQFTDRLIELKHEKIALALEIDELTTYFGLQPIDRQAVSTVEFHAGRVYGHQKVAALLTAVLAPLRTTEKRAGHQAPLSSFSRPDLRETPYREIHNCIKRAEHINSLQQQADRQRGSVPSSPFAAPQDNLAIGEKYASLLNPRMLLNAATNAAVTSSAVHGAMDAKKPNEENPALNKLNDPDHDSRMQSMSAQYTLQDLLANDEVISAADPEQVIKAFNEISQLSPHSAMRSGAMRPALRRALQGNSELHEADQILGMESSLQGTSGTKKN